MSKIYTIGELLIDFIPNKKNCELKDVETFTRMAGGAPANVAVTASKLGSDSYFVGMLGKDSFGDFLKETIESYGVNTNYLYQTDKAKTSLAFVSLREDGQRDFSFYRNPGADMLLEKSHVSEIELNKRDLISFCSVDLVEYPVKHATRKLLEMAKSVGSTVLFDPNLRLMLWDNHEELKETILDFMQYASIVKISDDELEFITEYSDQDEAVQFIKSRFDVNIIVTKGKDGATAIFGEKEVSSKIENVKAIDTTGAGDAFVGAVLNFIDKKEKSIDDYTSEEIKEMLDFGNKVASISVTKYGAMASYPSIEEIK